MQHGFSIFSLDYAVEEKPSEVLLLQQLEEGGPEPLVFVLNANLLAMVKLVNCKPQRTTFRGIGVLSIPPRVHAVKSHISHSSLALHPHDGG